METIGIDAGGTLIKVVYKEKGQMHYKKFAETEGQAMINWLSMVKPNAHFVLTGGNAESLSSQFTHASVITEFEAVCTGAKHLLKEQQPSLTFPIVLVNIGTGTSIFLLDESEHQRINGTGIGGGTFIGLGGLLSGTYDYHQLVELARKGTRNQVDLLVKDIYKGDAPPVLGDLTAANFAKGTIEDSKPADRIRALVNMIAETIILLSSTVVSQYSASTIAFVGGALYMNDVLKKDLQQFESMLHYEALFLDHGLYTGAMGAYLLGE